MTPAFVANSAHELGYAGMAAATSLNYAGTAKGTGSAMRAASVHAVGFVGENSSYAALANASQGGTIDEETGEVKK